VFTNYLASETGGTALLNCLNDLLNIHAASAAALARDRKVLGLMRNACSGSVKIHLLTAEHAFDCWEGVKSLVVSQCEANSRQVGVAYSQLAMRSSENVTAFVRRVEELRKVLTFANVVQSDLSAKQTILKGLPPQFAPVSTSSLYGSDVSSLQTVSVLDLLGRLRGFETSLDNPSTPKH
jgi:hypothetical protein